MPPTTTDQAAELYRRASNEWGRFRRTLALHPLTCFWLAIVGGMVLGALLGAAV